MATTHHRNLKPYPAAATGKKRLVITLPAIGNGNPACVPEAGEDEWGVELIFGKRMMTDGVNRVNCFLGVTKKLVEGYQYPYWEVEGGESDFVMSTLIGVVGKRERVSTFVHGSSLKIGYNSLLPIVVYCDSPKVEVRWRIWKVDGATKKMEEG
jgi:serine protease inhibitor ecotin